MECCIACVKLSVTLSGSTKVCIGTVLVSGSRILIYLSPFFWFFLGFLGCCALLAAGAYMQFVEELEPCPLCISQRLAMLATGIVMVGLQRMRRILAIDAEARTATVEPGVVNVNLTKAATPYGLHYAPDPSSQSACTIGGNVGENAGGPHCLKYGVTLNHIVAATVVLPDGEVLRLEAPHDDAIGLDLLGAFVGSEGCFGIAVDITVKLTPNPQRICTMLADFMTLDAAAEAVSAIVAAGIVPAALELVDAGTIAAGNGV